MGLLGDYVSWFVIPSVKSKIEDAKVTLVGYSIYYSDRLQGKSQSQSRQATQSYLVKKITW